MDPTRGTLAAARAKALLGRNLLQQLRDEKSDNSIHSLPREGAIPPLSDHVSTPLADTAPPGPICIVGAGAAGLMVAMCLQWVGIYDIDIVEASNRVGGRIYTQKLDTSNDPHNYYDVGAMRIPLIETMASTINLIENPQLLNIKNLEAPYVYDADVVPSMYFYKDGPPVLATKLDAEFSQTIASIVNDFSNNFDQAFEDYVLSDPSDPKSKAIDHYTTREFLRSKNNINPRAWSYDEIQDVEMLETSTGLFDQAFSETIIDYCDFAATKTTPPKPWIRLEGGMAVLTDHMRDSVIGQGAPKITGPGANLQLNTAVTSMQDNGETISVTTLGTTTSQSSSKNYATVFNSTALACLERMDLSGLKLDDDTLTMIRCLSYDRASKVAIKFSKNWWTPLLKTKSGGSYVYGGVSSSDLPISNVVYPSWNDGDEQDTVLMISYAWAQDATRMGALIPDYSDQNPPQKTDQVVTLCLQNLAKLWENTSGAPSFDQLLGMYVSHHAFAWSHDPYTGGAFALFGPSQFRNCYPKFAQTYCNGKFNICGEATSAHHAWISGALDSAYVTVMTWLSYLHLDQQKSVLKASPLGNGQDLHPWEMDEHLVQAAADLSAGGKLTTGGGLKDQSGQNGVLKH